VIKKLSCLLLLFSFLLVKGTPMYAAVFNQTEHVADQQGEEIPGQDQKERAEALDEDFTAPAVFAVSVMVIDPAFSHFAFPDMAKVYITLSNPPPDLGE
jgi:hypothetical protein